MHSICKSYGVYLRESLRFDGQFRRGNENNIALSFLDEISFTEAVVYTYLSIMFTTMEHGKQLLTLYLCIMLSFVYFRYFCSSLVARMLIDVSAMAHVSGWRPYVPPWDIPYAVPNCTPDIVYDIDA